MTSAREGDERWVLTQRLLTTLASTTSPQSRDGIQQQVVALNTGLALRLARRYRGRGVEDADLDQVALLGLWKAVLRYQDRPTSTFAAFAVPTIQGELRRHFRDHAWLVRPTRRVQEHGAAVARATEELRSRLSREPSVADLSAHLGLTKVEVEDARAARLGYFSTSLDHPAQGSDLSWAEVLGDPDPAAENAEWSVTLRAVIATLPARQQQLVRLRYVEELSQQQIGQRMGISQMQVSRLLGKLTQQLRDMLASSQAA